MDRLAFEFLYLHANSIAELAFLRAAAALMAAPPLELTPEQLAANEAEAERMLHLTADQFDWSALEGVAGFDLPAGNGGQVPGAMVGDLPPPDDDGIPHDELPASVPTFGRAVDEAGAELEDGPPDIARYLANVEAARDMLQPRVSHCFARADLPAIVAALATLPVDGAPLTGALTPTELARWLDLYETGHEGMTAAVMEIRRLEPFC